MRWLLIGDDPQKDRFKLFDDAMADAYERDGKGRSLTKDDWPLDTDPVSYLERTPHGPRAKLARRLIDAGVY